MPHHIPARATWCAHPRELRGPWPEQAWGSEVELPLDAPPGCEYLQRVEMEL